MVLLQRTFFRVLAVALSGYGEAGKKNEGIQFDQKRRYQGV